MLIGAVLKYFAVLEIAPQAFPSVTTSPPEGRLLAMTVVVDDRQRLKNSTTNCNLKRKNDPDGSTIRTGIIL